MFKITQEKKKRTSLTIDKPASGRELFTVLTAAFGFNFASCDSNWRRRKTVCKELTLSCEAATRELTRRKIAKRNNIFEKQKLIACVDRFGFIR